MCKFILVALLVFFSINGVASAAEDDVFEIEAEGSYRMKAGFSIDLAKKMALFTAKRKAVDLAGRYLSRKSLIEVYELNRDEIYSLAAREIEAEILEENRPRVGKTSTYRLRIRARVQASDFVKAEMEDTNQEKKRPKRLIVKKWNSLFLPKLIRGETSPKHTGCCERRNGELRWFT